MKALTCETVNKSSKSNDCYIDSDISEIGAGKTVARTSRELFVKAARRNWAIYPSANDSTHKTARFAARSLVFFLSVRRELDTKGCKPPTGRKA